MNLTKDATDAESYPVPCSGKAAARADARALVALSHLGFGVDVIDQALKPSP